MKALKKILVVSVLALFALFVNHQGLRADYNLPCYDEDQEECSEWEEHSTPIMIPEFPQCNLEVDYITRICDGKLQVYIRSIKFEVESNPNCSIVNCFYPNYPNLQPTNPDCWRTVWESLYSQIAYLDFLSKTANWTNLQKDQFLCGSGYYATKVMFSGNVCMKYCYDFDVIIEPGHVPIYRFVVIRSNCTEIYCCKITKKYCYEKIWDPILGQWTYYSQEVEERTTDGYVDCNLIDGWECPEGFIGTDCYPVCDVPEQ